MADDEFRASTPGSCGKREPQLPAPKPGDAASLHAGEDTLEVLQTAELDAAACKIQARYRGRLGRAVAQDRLEKKLLRRVKGDVEILPRSGKRGKFWCQWVEIRSAGRALALFQEPMQAQRQAPPDVCFELFAEGRRPWRTCCPPYAPVSPRSRPPDCVECDKYAPTALEALSPAPTLLAAGVADEGFASHEAQHLARVARAWRRGDREPRCGCANGQASQREQEQTNKCARFLAACAKGGLPLPSALPPKLAYALQWPAWAPGIWAGPARPGRVRRAERHWPTGVVLAMALPGMPLEWLARRCCPRIGPAPQARVAALLGRTELVYLQGLGVDGFRLHFAVEEVLD